MRLASFCSAQIVTISKTLSCVKEMISAKPFLFEVS